MILLDFYGNRIPYDGRELGICFPSKDEPIRAMYSQFDAFTMQKNSSEVPQEDFVVRLRYFRNASLVQLQTCAGERAGPREWVDEIKKYESSIKNTNDFFNILLAILE